MNVMMEGDKVLYETMLVKYIFGPGAQVLFASLPLMRVLLVPDHGTIGRPTGAGGDVGWINKSI